MIALHKLISKIWSLHLSFAHLEPILHTLDADIVHRI